MLFEAWLVMMKPFHLHKRECFPQEKDLEKGSRQHDGQDWMRHAVFLKENPRCPSFMSLLGSLAWGVRLMSDFARSYDLQKSMLGCN